MSELKELESRLNAAMDRLEDGVGALDASGGNDAELTAELDAAKATNAALEESLAGQQDKLSTLDGELQRLREVSRQLEENNRALREACETGQVDAALINKAMLTELESLRAARSADQAEAAAALASLDALVASVGEDA